MQNPRLVSVLGEDAREGLRKALPEYAAGRGRNKNRIGNVLKAEELSELAKHPDSQIIDPGELIPLIRNLTAHAGLQYYSARNLLSVIDPRGGFIEVLIYYNTSLFVGIDKVASNYLKRSSRSLGLDEEELPDILWNEAGFLCDIRVS